MDFPPLNETAFRRLDELTEVRPLQYFRPGIANFESVDAFAVLPARLFDAAAEEHLHVLVGFQMTVSQNHPVNGSGMKRVLERVRAVVKDLPAPPPGRTTRRPPQHPLLEMFLVFVTDGGAVLTKQKVKRDDGEDFVFPDAVAKQFSASLGRGFDDLVKATRPWEE